MYAKLNMYVHKNYKIKIINEIIDNFRENKKWNFIGNYLLIISADF